MANENERYSPDLTLLDAREIYFAINGFDGGGYDDRWVKVEFGFLRFYFPNTKSRAKAVKYHDLHHVLTEYETNLDGECEIGAWEVASGCGTYVTAWFLNLSALALGLFINPKSTYRAFLRGRQSSYLYRLPFDEKLLSSKVGDVRRQLDLNSPPASPTLYDGAVFTFWSFIGVSTLSAVVGIPIATLIFVFIRFI
jgi:hypothetical protein